MADDTLVAVLVNGVPFGGWLEVTIKQDMDKCSGTASITFSEQPGVPVPIHLGDKVQVLIGVRSVIKGHAHEFSGTHDDAAHTMTVEVRDQTQDFIDSTVGPKLKLKPPLTLKQMLGQTLGAMGLPHIKVKDEVNPEPYKQGEVISGSVDDPGFKLADDWAQKREVLLGPDGEGNIVITRNLGKRGPGALYKSYEDSPRNNVLSAEFKNSDLNRHNTTAVAGQKSTNDKDHWESKPKGEPDAQADPLQKRWGAAHDGMIRPERRLHIRGSKGINGGTPKKTAKWRSSAAKGRGFQYTATVQGVYGAPGWLWWPGFIIPVRDDHFEIATELLITGVEFHKTFSGGSTTKVSCAPKDSFTDKEGGDGAGDRTGGGGAGSVGSKTHAPVSRSDMGID